MRDSVFIAMHIWASTLEFGPYQVGEQHFIRAFTVCQSTHFGTFLMNYLVLNNGVLLRLFFDSWTELLSNVGISRGYL